MASTLYLNVHLNFRGAGVETIVFFARPEDAGEEITVSNAAGYEETIVLDENGTAQLTLPESVAMSGTGVNNLGLMIESEADLSAYFSSRERFTTDLSVVFREESLGTDYVLASVGGAFNDGGQFSVQALEDATEITFTLPDGQTATVTLDRGETFKFSTTDGTGNDALGISVPDDFDLTGTLVTASAPAAVFSGHGLANVGRGAADFLIEQMPAIDDLSTSHIVGETFANGSGNNLVRVIAALDGTEVTLDGAVVATLGAGEFYEFTLSDPASVIDTSQPVLVAQYLQGRTTAGEGDPALAFVPGEETWLNAYALATPSGTQAFNDNVVNLVVRTDALSTLVVNGEPVDEGLFTPIENTPYSVANVPVPPGVVTASAAEPFQLSVAGYESFDSYLTFGGASFAPTTANIAPRARDDAFDVADNAVLTGDLFADNGAGPDRDINNDPLSVIEVNGADVPASGDIVLPSGSTLRLTGAGDFTYTPGGALARLDEGETGQDSFTYTVSDGRGGTDDATATITVNGAAAPQVGDLTITLPDGLAAGEAGTAVITRTLQDGDPASGPILVAVDMEGGLAADPFTGDFADTVFVLVGGVDPSEEGRQTSVEIEVKGAAGPNSRVTAEVAPADPDFDPQIDERFASFQPDYVEDATVARIQANLELTLGDSIADLTAALAPLAERLSSFNLNDDSAGAALGFALETAGAFGAVAERGMDGSLGQGWASLADISLDIDGPSVQMRGLTDLEALRALSLDVSALYAVSNAAGRSVLLSGDALAVTPPDRPEFEQGIDGRFQTTSAFAGTLRETAGGYEIEADDGERLIFDQDGVFLRMELRGGLQITANHDDDMRIVELSGPNGARLSFTRDADGRIEAIENADGDAMTLSYDADGRLQTVERPEGVSSFAYNADGDLISAAAPGDIRSAFTYDALGRLESAQYGGGLQTETFAFDNAGGLTITDGAGRTTQIDLLPGSLASRIVDGEGGGSEIIYRDGGGIAGVRAPDGTETLFDFDGQERLTQITDANGAQLRFAYGESGEDPASFTDAGGGTRSFEYDEAGRITTATWPDGTTLQFIYDDEGNLTGYSNRRGDGVIYTYDERGRLISESDSSAGPTTYTYDAQGRLTSATNDQGTTSLTYDGTDRVTQIDYPTGRSLFFTYNEAGLRASISDGGDYNIFYEYDALGRLTGLRDEDGQIVSYEYDAAGNLVREENGNGTVSIFTYDDAGRLTRIENQAPDGSVNSFNAYTYDAAGQRITNETQDGIWTYGYDAIGQLTSAHFLSTNPDIDDKSLTYEYDAAGNRTRVVEDGEETIYVANALNQYTQVGDATFTYDADGNMTSRTDPSGTTTYAYDLDNRLTSVTEADGTVLEFEYDVFGNRVAKAVDGAETEYLVDPFGLGDVVSEFAGGTLTATYAHGLGLAAGEIGGVDAFYDADAVGTVTTLTGSGGAIANSYVFTPFGSEISEIEALSNDFEFNGALGVQEDTANLSFMRSRTYDDKLGRFVSEDPNLVEGDILNLYRFGLNDPLDYADPGGEVPLPVLVVLWGLAPAAGATGYAIAAGATAAVGYAAYKTFDTATNAIGSVVAIGYGMYKGNDAIVEAGAANLVTTGFGYVLPKTLRVNELGFNLGLDAVDLGTGFNFQEDGAQFLIELGDKSPERPEPPALGDDSALAPPAPTRKPEPPVSDEGDAFTPPIPARNPRRLENAESGASDGDPHLRTFDGVGYSFQAAGEFILFRTEDGQSEVQVRQEPFGDSDRVSVNTAVAVRIGEDTVAVYADEAIPLAVNGRAVFLERGESIAVGEGSVYFDGRAYVITDAEGNGVWARVNTSREFLNLRTFLNEESVGRVEGLLGDADGDRSNDFTLADGTVLPQPLAQTVLYGAFAAAWRITQEISLFDYREGEDTNTFTDPNFPANFVSLDDLDPAAREAAEVIALEAGLTPGTFEFETTVLDIAITGLEDFAEAVADAPVLDPEDDPADIVPVEINEAPQAVADTATVDEDASVTIDVLANDTDPEGDALTLVGGSDPNGGAVTVEDGRLVFAPAPDFAGSTELTYELADAGGNTVFGAVTVTVNPVPDAPTALDVTGLVVAENAAAGTLVGELSTQDPDEGDTFTYSLSEDAGGRFAIDGDRLVVAEGGELDFEAVSEWDVTLVSTDSDGLTIERTVTVSLTDVNEAPTAIALDQETLEENAPGGTVVGVLSAEDPDAGDDAFTYVLLDDAGGRFELDGDRIVVAEGADLDFELSPSLDVVVEAADADGLSVEQALSINLTDLDENFDGGPGDDVIFGDAGDNVIDAGAGDDRIDGGLGDDRLTGGEGADVFVVSEGDDVIEDFFGFTPANEPIDFLWLKIPVSRPADQIDVSGLDLSFADFESQAEQLGDDVVWRIDDDTTLTIANSQLNDIVEEDFLF